MDRLKYVIFIFSFFIMEMVFSYSIEEGEALIANHKYDMAVEYFSSYENEMFPIIKEIKENLDEYSLVVFYLSLTYYKIEKYEKAYEELKKAYDINNRKLGFNILMGLIIIKLGELEGDSQVISQGYAYLKKASLYEGIRLRNSIIIDSNGIRIRKKAIYTIRRVNNIDPEGKITYEYYHNLLLKYYEEKQNLSSLSVEYEKLLILNPDKEEIYKKLFDLYERLQYYDNYSFILKVFMKKFNIKKQRGVFLKFLLTKIQSDFNGKNYLECERGLLLITKDDYKLFTQSELINYYIVSLKLYKLLNLKNKLFSVLDEIVSRENRRIEEDFLIILGDSVLFLYKDSEFYEQNQDKVDSFFQFVMDLGKKYYPDSLYTYLFIGEFFLARGKYQDAKEIFNQLKELPEQNTQAHLSYILFLSEMAYKYYVENRIDINGEKLNNIFEDFFNEIENLKKNNIKMQDKNEQFEYYFTLGKMNFLKGITLGTIDKNLNYNDLYERDKYMEAAIDALLIANNIEANNLVLLNYLGWAYIYKRRFREAFNVYKRILQYYPYDSNARLQLKYIKNNLLK